MVAIQVLRGGEDDGMRVAMAVVIACSRDGAQGHAGEVNRTQLVVSLRMARIIEEKRFNGP